MLVKFNIVIAELSGNFLFSQNRESGSFEKIIREDEKRQVFEEFNWQVFEEFNWLCMGNCACWLSICDLDLDASASTRTARKKADRVV